MNNLQEHMNIWMMMPYEEATPEVTQMIMNYKKWRWVNERLASLLK